MKHLIKQITFDLKSIIAPVKIEDLNKYFIIKEEFYDKIKSSTEKEVVESIEDYFYKVPTFTYKALTLVFTKDNFYERLRMPYDLQIQIKKE